MKKLAVLLFALITLQSSSAQGYNFVAQKGFRTIEYSVGTPVRLRLQNDSLKTLKGYYYGAAQNGIYLSSFNTNDSVLRYVECSHITGVVKLLRRQRKKIITAAAAGVAITGIFVIASKGSIFKSPMGYIAFIPAFTSAFILVYGLPITYASEFVQKKTLKRGWTFMCN